MAMEKASKVLQAALVLSVVFAAAPVWARHSSAPHHLYNDPAEKVYSPSGLPSSTAPVTALPQAKPENSLNELDKIEKQNAGALRAISAREGNRNGANYRPAVPYRSEKTSAINFNYQPPRQGGNQGGQNRGRGR